MPNSVLFACNYNAIRSPMAEAMLKHMAGNRIYVDSVGVRRLPADRAGLALADDRPQANPFAIAVMEEIGLDLARHRPKTFDDLQDESFDLVISLSPQAHHRAIEMTRTTACEVEFWPTIDPTEITGNREQRLAVFREMRDTLLRRIRDRFAPGGSPAV